MNEKPDMSDPANMTAKQILEAMSRSTEAMSSVLAVLIHRAGGTIEVSALEYQLAVDELNEKRLLPQMMKDKGGLKLHLCKPKPEDFFKAMNAALKVGSQVQADEKEGKPK